MNVVKKLKEDLNSEKKAAKARQRKISVNEPLEIILSKKSDNSKDINNNKNVKIPVPEVLRIDPPKAYSKKSYKRPTKLIHEVTHFANPVDDSYDADSEYETFALENCISRQNITIFHPGDSGLPNPHRTN